MDATFPSIERLAIEGVVVIVNVKGVLVGDLLGRTAALACRK